MWNKCNESNESSMDILEKRIDVLECELGVHRWIDLMCYAIIIYLLVGKTG